MINLFNYIERPSPIHKLTGASKLIALLMFSISTMTNFYTPFLAVVAVIALVLFRVSKIRLREVSFLVGVVTVFMLMNNVLIFLFSPEHGVSLYGSRHVLLSFGGRYAVTQEQLFYHLNVLQKLRLDHLYLYVLKILLMNLLS